MNREVLRVGIDDAPPAPLQLGNPDTGDFRGYEVDVLQEVGRRIGCRFAFRRALWSTIIFELMEGEVDLVCSAATISAERAREVVFSLPYLDVSLAVVKPAGSGGLEIDGLRLGVRQGTTAEAYVQQRTNCKFMRKSESNDELYALLAARELDAVIDDSPIAKWFSDHVPGLRFAGIFPGTDAHYAIMLRKGNDRLQTEINEALQEMTNDGTRRILLQRWFGETAVEANR